VSYKDTVIRWRNDEKAYNAGVRWGTERRENHREHRKNPKATGLMIIKALKEERVYFYPNERVKCEE